MFLVNNTQHIYNGPIKMSKNSKASRAKSGSSLRPLGALRFAQAISSRPNVPHVPAKNRNDPALHINQLQTMRISSPPNQLIKEKEKEFKAREQKLRDHISALEKLIAELRFELKTKNEILEALKKTLDAKIKYYEEKLAEKDEECKSTKEMLEASEADAVAKQKKMNHLIEEYDKKIQDLKDEYEKRIKTMEEEREEELKERDEKLQMLKQRMAETIGKHSSERQQQLEELKRDLIKASQEAKDLHRQLKHLQKHPTKCPNCITLAAQLDDKCLQLRLKEKTVNDLQNIGKSMQLQLNQQDMILTKWEEREKRE